MTSMRYGPVQLSSPPGFQNILRLISQEVLRVQPEDTLGFIAAFVKDLLEIRENTGYDPVIQGEMIERVKEQYHKIRYEREEHTMVEVTQDQRSPPKSQPEMPATPQQETTQMNDAVSQTPTAELATSGRTPRGEDTAENKSTAPETQADNEPVLSDETTDEDQGVQDMDDDAGDEETTLEDINMATQAVDSAPEPAAAEQEPTDE